MRAHRLLAATACLTGLLGSAACSDDTGEGAGGAGAGDSGTGGAATGSETGAGGASDGGGGAAAARVSIEGDVLAFMSEVGGERVAGATVSILEQPERSVITGDDAHFRFDDLEVGTDVTLVVEHPDFKTTQTATVTLGEHGIDPFSIQIVPRTIFVALSNLVPLPLEEEDHCVIATTVARMGGSLYVHLRQGVAGAEVALDPPVAAESGPIYFDESVLPDPEQPSTSVDGGVLFYRVTPGDYVMTASRPDTVFNSVRFRCRAGVVVNAGPPMGLLANVAAPDRGAGAALPADPYTDATDALCEATAACVNAENAGHYPDAMLASCKAMFRDVWAQVTSCDDDHALRDAARALYTCRVSSCEVTLGGDDVCVPEEDAFAAAQDVYGACLAAGG